jgi:hypothetical protein
MRTENGEKKAKEARAAYNREHIRTLGANFRKEDAEAFRQLAERRGTTASAIIKSYVQSELAKEAGARPFSMANPYATTLTAKNFDRLKHETAFHNPKNLNPDQMMNAILDDYFRFVEKVRA